MGRITHQHSAGGVVIKGVIDDPYVLLIKPSGRDRWQLPKGHIDAGESAENAAMREVREEGGVDARVLAPLEPIRFFYQMSGKRFVKTVDFFLMSYESGSVDDHDDEVDEACWFALDEARSKLTFESEQRSLSEAAAIYSRSNATARAER